MSSCWTSTGICGRLAFLGVLLLLHGRPLPTLHLRHEVWFGNCIVHRNQRLVVAPHHVLVELFLPLGQVPPLLLGEVDGDIIEGDRNLGDLSIAARGQAQDPEISVFQQVLHVLQPPLQQPVLLQQGPQDNPLAL